MTYLYSPNLVQGQGSANFAPRGFSEVPNG